MNCPDCQALIIDYQHGELEPALDGAVHAHVQSCKDCHDALDLERTLSDSLRTALHSDRELPMTVVAAVRQAMHGQAAPSFGDRLAALLRPAILAPMAVIVAVVAFGSLHNGQNRPTGPTLSATYFVRQHVARTLGSPSSDRAWAAYLLTTANAERVSDGAVSQSI
ncbi:MAG: zf-HC2 domain-containing protein [Candidatus Eremiobacteraeota bacterium]|nr:zf-HC2 domain-containing protein [Candidatus Eremiobacteraeota bacterium]MBC5827257.1 zf-HC2 domain-containing protein [Candidatus Eremiobacteraeota bacterium]